MKEKEKEKTYKHSCFSYLQSTYHNLMTTTLVVKCWKIKNSMPPFSSTEAICDGFQHYKQLKFGCDCHNSSKTNQLKGKKESLERKISLGKHKNFSNSIQVPSAASPPSLFNAFKKKHMCSLNLLLCNVYLKVQKKTHFPP